MSDSNLPRKAKQYVKHETNQVYEPVVFTSEVADELGVSEEVAHEALEESPFISEKEVDGTSVWW
ncbi:hypothetical protein [Natronococcus sp. A-GB7]|uniref:hypothetical protein n=1 Tax=Natronococcus sp. A-GB7 TaxID=3037649 RepID=UPI00241DEDD4|nr:hypothetical protein [Natronococcus sp. A-GB7]MDG5821927.1 hypothetical protein [Natronococcus sp. A-GB7]